jgi:hypothetical protein
MTNPHMTSGTFNYIRFPGTVKDDRVPLVSRPCFFCGEIMDIIKPVRQLVCKKCDVFEACDPLTYVAKLDGTAETGPWRGETYLDHSQQHAPTPLRRQAPGTG